MLLIPARARLPDGRSCMNLLLTAPREAAMDETGMSYADKVEFVDDVLRTWGEEAAQEVAERYAVDLQALKREGSNPQPNLGQAGASATPIIGVWV